MAVFLPLYCGHRTSPCIRRPIVHLGPITRTYHGPEGDDPPYYDPTHCPLGVCSKKSPKKKKNKKSPKSSPKVSPKTSPKVSPSASPGTSLPVPKVPCETGKVKETPPQTNKNSVVKQRETDILTPPHGEFSPIVVTTPPKEDTVSPKISPTGEPDDTLWSHELHLHNIKLSNLKVSLVESNRVYIEEHQDLSMGNQDELYESYTRRQMVLVPDSVDITSLSAYLYHHGVLLLTAKRTDGSTVEKVRQTKA